MQPWVRRLKVDLADSVIRCLPGEDKTNGFFVACFIKGERRSNKTKKRPREEAAREEAKEVPISNVDIDNPAEISGVPVAESKASKEKTAAQLARKRRKKQSQQARRVEE